jgi:hypothetical protein
MQVEIIEQIIHLPIAERVEIIEKISRSVREDLREKDNEKFSLDERKTAYLRLRGIAAVEGKTPPTDEEIKEDYNNYLAEKYK